MLQDTQSIRYYQKLTDTLVDHWQRGYRMEELRFYLDGYLAALRHSSALEPFLINRLEDAVTRYIYDPSNFAEPEPEPELDYR